MRSTYHFLPCAQKNTKLLVPANIRYELPVDMTVVPAHKLAMVHLTVVTLLFHCCHTVVTLLLHDGYIGVTLSVGIEFFPKSATQHGLLFSSVFCDVTRMLSIAPAPPVPAPPLPRKKNVFLL
jgi:hypothetical protein